MVSKPNAVIRVIENKAVTLHTACEDLQDDRLTMTLAYLMRCVGISAEMNVVASAFFQTAARINSSKGCFCCTVIERFWWKLRRISQINAERVSLVSADFAAICIEGKTFLAVGGDNMFKQDTINRRVVRIHLADKRIHIRPALRIQRDANGFRMMTQDEAKKFAEFDVALFRSHESF